jgi:4-hydroxybenzoate polyprenyltransferase
MVVATVCIAAGGYVINDYYDVKIDKKNRQDKNIVGQIISPKISLIIYIIITIAGAGLGLYVSYTLELPVNGLVFPLAAILLFIYSRAIKKMVLVGNILVAALTGIVPLLVLLYEMPLLNKAYGRFLEMYNMDFNNIVSIVMIFSIFAFFINLARELIKDVKDMPGDKQYGRKTMPVALGVNGTKAVSIILLLIELAGVVYIYFAYLQYINRKEADVLSPVYLSLLIVIPLAITCYQIITAKHKADYGIASNMLKFIMVTGLCYLLIFRHITLHYFA